MMTNIQGEDKCSHLDSSLMVTPNAVSSSPSFKSNRSSTSGIKRNRKKTASENLNCPSGTVGGGTQNRSKLNTSDSGIMSRNFKKIIDFNRDDGYVDDEDDYDDDVDNNNDSENDDEENNQEANERASSYNRPNDDSFKDSDQNEEPVDPRIQVELERLNKASTDINKLENELEEAKALFISTKNRQAQRIEYLQKKLGTCIQKSKPYYDASQAKDRLQKETQRAVQEFQKAISHYKTAKETLAVAEQNLSTNGISDVWQEYLSETITKINNYKKNADQAEEYHRSKTLEYQMCEKRLQFLEKDLKRNIEKSQCYYEEKFRWTLQMEAQRTCIYDIERALINEKRTYADAMNSLRIISDEIHSSRRMRKCRQKQRIDECIDVVRPNETKSTHKKPLRKSISKSLDDLAKTSDNTDDNLSTEQQTNFDVSSNDSKQSTMEKRNLYAIKSQKQLTEYFSFNTQAITSTNSVQSSRSSSPHKVTSLSIAHMNSLDCDESIRSSKSFYHIRNKDSIDEPTDITQLDSTELDSTSKFTPVDTLKNEPDIVITRQSTSTIQTDNTHLPAKASNTQSAVTSKPYETPLLANLLLYNSMLTKATNNFAVKSLNKSGNDLTKPRSNSFNIGDKTN